MTTIDSRGKGNGNGICFRFGNENVFPFPDIVTETNYKRKNVSVSGTETGFRFHYFVIYFMAQHHICVFLGTNGTINYSIGAPPPPPPHHTYLNDCGAVSARPEVAQILFRCSHVWWYVVLLSWIISTATWLTSLILLAPLIILRFAGSNLTSKVTVKCQQWQIHHQVNLTPRT